MTEHKIVVIGGGPAGMAAAVAAYDSGITDVVMEIGNEIDFDNSITEIYFDTIEQTLKEMLDALYDDVLGKL